MYAARGLRPYTNHHNSHATPNSATTTNPLFAISASNDSITPCSVSSASGWEGKREMRDGSMMDMLGLETTVSSGEYDSSRVAMSYAYQHFVFDVSPTNGLNK